MRHNQNRRSRGRSRKGPNPLSRSYESNGPDVKVRGNAAHVAEKYMALARDALSSGDTVAAENYFQHAEHYNRIVAAAQAQVQQAQPQPPMPASDDSEEDVSVANGESRNGADRGNGRSYHAEQGESAEAPDAEAEAPQRRPRRRPRQDDEQTASAETGPRDEREAQQDDPGAGNGRRPRRRRSEQAANAERDAPERDKPESNKPEAAAESDEDKTRDGAAALAAFPD